MSKYAIEVAGLSKKYEIGERKAGTLYNTLRNIWPRFKDGKSRKPEEFWALKDVNFNLEHGQILGIIGHNGAGKSTLLKILSRITEPTEGQVILNGRVSSLLEVGTGFHHELTGRENVFLNGSILGMRHEEISRKFDEIVDFAGVEKFIDTPVKHYSSGMYVRLAFAVAAHLESDILLVDEVLSVGDAEFQRKCLGKIDEVAADRGRAVIIVSHNLAYLRMVTSKAIYINSGSIVKIGAIDQSIDAYLNNNRSNVVLPKYIKEVAIRCGSSTNVSNVISDSENVKLRISFEDLGGYNVLNLYVAIYSVTGLFIARLVAKIDINMTQTSTVIFNINNLNLTNGNYYLGAYAEENSKLIFHYEKLVDFKVEYYDLLELAAKKKAVVTLDYTCTTVTA